MNWKRRPMSPPTQDGETYACYLRDLGYLLREAGDQSRDDVARAAPEDRVFEQGRLMAYVEVLSLMQPQADTFGIPLSELCLDGLDPENDLLT